MTAWLDARAADEADAGRRWSRRSAGGPTERAARRRHRGRRVTPESLTPRVAFDTGLRDRLAGGCWRRAGAADRRRPRRRGAGRARAHRDAVRPQPHRRVARPGRGAPPTTTAPPAWPRSPTCWRSWRAGDAVAGHAEYAWLGGRAGRAGRAHRGRRGRFTAVDCRRARPPRGAARLPGPDPARPGQRPLPRLPPGAARAHPGRPGHFWTWRERMYERGRPARPRTPTWRWPRAVYAEMALAGVTCVGEFHYLHHRPDGARTTTRTRWARRWSRRRPTAGVRLTLLDTCYLTATVDGQPLAGVQRRFGDGDAEAWARRGSPRCGRTARTPGSAPRSTRCAPCRAARCRPWRPGPPSGAPRCTCTCPSSRPRTRPAWRSTAAPRPQLLAEPGGAGERTTAVHATHLTDVGPGDPGRSGTGSACAPPPNATSPTGSARPAALADAGTPALPRHRQPRDDRHVRGGPGGGDARTAAHRRRGHFPADRAAHRRHRGRARGARLAGRRADRAGRPGRPGGGGAGHPTDRRYRPAAVPFTATAADIRHVLVDGRVVVRDGHTPTWDVLCALTAAIAAVTE